MSLPILFWVATFGNTSFCNQAGFVVRFTIRIHTLDLNFQGSPGLIAAFLLEGVDGTLALIETGPESCRLELLKQIKQHCFDPSDISAVFVTHIHLDHAGGAGWWAQQGVPVYVHPKGAKHLIDPSRLEASARSVYGDRFDSLWGALTAAPEPFVKIIEDGQTVDLAADLHIQAIDTPGHAFHHHAYAVGDSLFTGDSAGARLPGIDYISVTSAPPQFDLEHTLATIDHLAGRSFTNLYLTHFGEITDPATHWQDYRQAVELNAQFVSDRLSEGMDADALHIAYQAFNLEQAYRLQVPRADWQRYQTVNGTDMCADGIRIYWEKRRSTQTV